MFREPRSSLPKVFIDSRVEIKESPIHGWGVFSKEDIPAHVLIESAPLVVCHKATTDALYEMNDTRHILQDYPFTWKDGMIAFAMGWAAVYNHKRECNALWRQNFEYTTIEFTTIKEIKAGEEITVKYLPTRYRGSLWFIDEEDDEINVFNIKSPSPNNGWDNL